jgi:glutamate synthase (NADPH/NADH) small chain
LEITEEGVIYQKTSVTGLNDNGKEIVEFIEDSQELFPCDSVILAIGQKPRRNIVNNTKDIDINSRGLLVTDEYGRTTKEGVFASGDVVTGAKTVVEAVRVSKVVAQAIEEYIESQE